MKKEIRKTMVPRWVTLDGEAHTTLAEAQRHAKLINLEEWYVDHKIYGDGGAGVGLHIVDSEVLVKWLDENKEKILDYYKPVEHKNYEELEDE
ncbi:MAG: hypothetical protein HKM94_08155 [Halobacteria archaeon]|nr:hypothetical protein [Halobacteria archaeon]